MKKTLSIVLCFILVFSLFPALSSEAVVISKNMKTTENLNMRTGPGTAYTRILTIPKGTTVPATESENGWIKLTYGGKTGWSIDDYLVEVVTTPAPDTNESGKVMVTTANLNFRTGPGTSYSSMGLIPSGTSVTVNSSTNGWYNVNYSGKTGWCSQNYLVAAPNTPVTPVEPTQPQEPTPPATPVTTMMATDNLNMRTGPATTFEKITTIPAGTSVTVTETASNGWKKVTFGTYSGWCHPDYLKVYDPTRYRVLSVPYFSQLTPVYAPVGCEAVSTFMLLRFKGMATDISLRTFLDRMPKDNDNPRYGFAGSPYVANSTIRTTIFPIPLTDYVNVYAAGRGVNLEGSSVETIKQEILNGNPVVAYMTSKYADPIYAQYLIDGNRETHLKNNHVILVTGYDGNEQRFRITDPWSWSGRREYWISEALFTKVYNFRKHAITVR